MILPSAPQARCWLRAPVLDLSHAAIAADRKPATLSVQPQPDILSLIMSDPALALTLRARVDSLRAAECHVDVRMLESYHDAPNHIPFAAREIVVGFMHESAQELDTATPW